jgi:hypothetical protein
LLVLLAAENYTVVCVCANGLISGPQLQEVWGTAGSLRNSSLHFNNLKYFQGNEIQISLAFKYKNSLHPQLRIKM